MSDFSNEKYPVCALKPKAETNVLNFLQKYPEYNGKDTIIAILGKFPHSLKFLVYSQLKANWILLIL